MTGILGYVGQCRHGAAGETTEEVRTFSTPDLNYPAFASDHKHLVDPLLVS